MNVWYHIVASCGVSGFAPGDVTIFVALVTVIHCGWDEARIAREKLVSGPLYGAFGV